MRRLIALGLLGLALVGFTSNALAQSPSESPAASESPSPALTERVFCVSILEATEEAWDAASLQSAIASGAVTISGVADPEACAPTPSESPLPSATQPPSPSPTSAPTATP